MKDIEDLPQAIIESIDKVEGSHTYQSGLKGAIDETGKILTTVGKAVNTVLLPIEGLIWGADEISGWLKNNIAEKLKDVPPEKIIPPDPQIAGPAIEAMRFTAQESELRGMFASLLANSINVDTAKNAHPAFVDIIKSMNHTDALVLKQLSKTNPCAIIDIGVEHINEGNKSVTYPARNVSLLGVWAGIADPWLAIPSIENLERLGLASIIKDRNLNNQGLYEDILANPSVAAFVDNEITDESLSAKHTKGGVVLTAFGNMFVRSCIG